MSCSVIEAPAETPLTISVVIPTYNRTTLLARALDSVLAQTHQPQQIIVVDDGSSDHTAQMISANYSQVHYISQQHSGVSRARNAGIEQATGNWIALLDSDDVWDQHKLAVQVDFLRQHPAARVCHTNEIWIRNERRVKLMRKHKKPSGWVYPLCLSRCVISPSSIMIAREVLQKVGLFDESLPACEDYDLWLRISAVYPIVLCQRELVIKYGGHADQLSNKYEAMDRFRVRALIKMLACDRLSDCYRQATIDQLRRKLSILYQGAKNEAPVGKQIIISSS